MTALFSRLIACYILLVSCSSCSGPFGAAAVPQKSQAAPQMTRELELLVKESHLRITGPKRPLPLDFTQEQRAMLIESPNLFPSLEVGRLYAVSAIFWVDEVRFIFSSSRVGDWQMSPGEPPKVVVFHTDSFELEETPYRGTLECYSRERMVVVPGDKGWDSRFTNKRHPDLPFADKRNSDAPFGVLTGRLGEILKVEEPSGYETKFSKFDCRSFNPKNDFPADGTYWIYPLNKGDGALGYAVAPKSKGVPQLVLFDAKGNIYGQESSQSNPSKVQYVSASRRYFIDSADPCGDSSKGSAAPGRALVFRVGQGFQEIWTPPLLTSMLDWCMLNLHKTDTAGGVVYIAAIAYDPQRQVPSPFRGLYIHMGERTHRFFKAHAGIAAVSPTGCLILVGYISETPTNSPEKVSTARIFNLCEASQR